MLSLPLLYIFSKISASFDITRGLFLGKMPITVASLGITRYQPQETEAVYNVLAIFVV